MKLIFENIEVEIDDIFEIDYLIPDFIELTKIIINYEKYSYEFFNFFIEKNLLEMYLYFFQQTSLVDR